MSVLGLKDYLIIGFSDSLKLCSKLRAVEVVNIATKALRLTNSRRFLELSDPQRFLELSDPLVPSCLRGKNKFKL